PSAPASAAPIRRWSPRTSPRCAAMNFPTWGSDVGADHGVPSKEMFARWMGFGAYSTLFEILNEHERNVWRDHDQQVIDITCESGQAGQTVVRFGDLGVAGDVEVFCREASEVRLDGEALTAGEDYEETDFGIRVPVSGETVLELKAKSLFR
ncbi:MAG: TIM-barrel domain-containing protein, partial [Phycisphaeraceae bacterium]